MNLYEVDNKLFIGKQWREDCSFPKFIFLFVKNYYRLNLNWPTPSFLTQSII